MVKIINPIMGESPLAGTISNLGKSLFSPLSSAESLQREQARKAQRENAETEALARLVTDRGGVQGLGADPMAQALQIVSGYDPNDFGRIGAIGAATSGGVNAPNTSEWLVGMGEGTASPWNLNANRAQDESQFSRTLGETMRQFNEKPTAALVDGQPSFVPQAGLFGDAIAPIRSETEVKGGLIEGLDPDVQMELLRGNEAGTTRNYITPDGTFLVNDQSIAQNRDVLGNPLPPGGYIGTVQGGADDVGLTNSGRGNVEGAVMAGDRFVNIADRMISLTQEDPTLFGPVGMLRAGGQEVGEALSNIGLMFGGPPEQVAAEARKKLAASGVSPSLLPELYDPNLPQVQMLGGLLLYAGASALAGQENRSVSDNDIAIFREIMGDPHGFFESAKSIQVKTSLARDMVLEHRRLAEQYLKQGVAITPELDLGRQAQMNVLARAPGTVPATAAPPAIGGGEVIQEPVRKQFMGANGPQWFRLVDGQWAPE